MFIDLKKDETVIWMKLNGIQDHCGFSKWRYQCLSYTPAWHSKFIGVQVSLLRYNTL